MKSNEKFFMPNAPEGRECCNTGDVSQGFVGALLAAPQLARALTRPPRRRGTACRARLAHGVAASSPKHQNQQGSPANAK
jgi:hypothetical protein